MTVGGSFYSAIRELALPVIPAGNYKGKVIGVDASMLIHRYMCRDPNAVMVLKQYWHMRKWFQRFVLDNHSHGITVHMIFDGTACPNKAGEGSSRADVREAAMAKWLKDNDYKALQKSCHVSWDLKRACIGALHEIEAVYTVAPYEADSQLA